MEAGAAKIKITPPLGLRMCGWFPETRYAQGVEDELYCRALVLQYKGKTIAIAGCDLLFLEKKYIDKICTIVEGKTDIPMSNILICCSHTHSGPQTVSLFGLKMPRQNKAYMNTLASLIAEAIINAQKKLAPCKACIASGKVSGIAENDRYLLKDKTIGWWAYTRDEIITPTGPVDPGVGVLHIKNINGKPIAILYNYACHANTAYCGARYSADYPGVSSSLLEDELGGIALFTQGACGNIHAIPSKTPDKMMEKAGKKLSLAVTEIIRKMDNYQAGLTLGSVKKSVSLPTRKLLKSEEEDMKRTLSRKNFEDIWGGDAERLKEEWFSLFRKRKIEHLNMKKREKIITTLHVIRIGDCLMVGNPGELFVEFGVEIKKRSPFPFTFIVELADDWVGYIPTETAFRLGGYQTWPVHLPKAPAVSAGRILTEKSLKLIGKIRKEKSGGNYCPQGIFE